MQPQNFDVNSVIFKNFNQPKLQPFDGTLASSWQSPSNIALIKYWGKKEPQIPMNPSLSFTLKNAFTETTVEAFYSKNNPSINYRFHNQPAPSFQEKLEKLLVRIKDYIPFIQHLKLEINSQNTFPHSAGIASSASSMSALALCLCDIENQLFSNLNKNDFFQKASFLSRLLSGSASRSVYEGVNIWGYQPYISGSSDEFSINANHLIDPYFIDYQDSILIIDDSEKKVSSTLGHSLMNNHIFAEKRFEQARVNLLDLLDAMKNKNEDEFIRIVENEALSLHAMMMTSPKPFMLMKPDTIKIIEKIVEIREQKGLKFCFTLDAGPNIHVLYHKNIKKEVDDVINKELIVNCERIKRLDDFVGCGPTKII